MGLNAISVAFFHVPNFFLSNIIISCVYENDIEETVVVSAKMSY